MIAQLGSYLDGLALWQATILVLAVSLGAAVAIEVIGFRLFRLLVGRTESRLDDIVFEELRLPVIVTVGLAGVYLLTQSPAAATNILAQEQLDQFFGRPSLSIIVLVWAWSLNRIVNRATDALADAGPRYDFAPVFSNVWTIFVFIAAGMAVLSIWHIEITPLLGAAGIAGIAIGFAAKDTVANFFGGLALYFDDTYKVGDYVVLESGDAGTVVKIGIRSTTLLTRSEVLVTVPNAMLNAGKVVNRSAPQRRMRIKLPIGVAYGTDIDEFEELMLAVTEAEDLVLEKPHARIRFRGFGDSALQYELLCWVASPTREGKAIHRLNRAIYHELAAAGIEIPFPQRDVTLVTEGVQVDPSTTLAEGDD